MRNEEREELKVKIKKDKELENHRREVITRGVKTRIYNKAKEKKLIRLLKRLI